MNLFEPASSGTKNISVRNPVYDLSLIHRFSNEKYHIEQNFTNRFFKKILAHTELENECQIQHQMIYKECFLS